MKKKITKILALILFALGLSGPALAQESIDLSGADAATGERAFRQCASCHTADEGGANRVGPNLWGIVDREVASDETFRYSAAMRAQEGTWTLERLDAYLTSPRTTVPGTSMSYAGLRNETHRLNLLAYLQSLQSAE